MAGSKRSGALLLGAVAVGLSVFGIVAAATDPNPMGLAKDTLVLNGYPPKTANILVTVSTGSAYRVSANVNVDFVHNTIEATVSLPAITSVSAIDLRLIDNHLYAGSASATSSKYLAIAMKQPSLFGDSLELTKPDIALISGFGQEVITHNGYITTYTYSRDNVAVSSLFGPSSSSVGVGSLTWSISTGSQGEVMASSATITSKGSTTSITATVESYNQPAHIVAPPASDVRMVPRSFLRKILHSAALLSIVVPRNFATLGQAQLN